MGFSEPANYTNFIYYKMVLRHKWVIQIGTVISKPVDDFWIYEVLSSTGHDDLFRSHLKIIRENDIWYIFKAVLCFGPSLSTKTINHE